MTYSILFNSGLSVEDTISLSIEASSKEESLELALNKNPELLGWSFFINEENT